MLRKIREQTVCKMLGVPHGGKPGEADCHHPKADIEVKDWDRPVDRSAVEKVYYARWRRKGYPLLDLFLQRFHPRGYRICGRNGGYSKNPSIYSILGWLINGRKFSKSLMDNQ